MKLQQIDFGSIPGFLNSSIGKMLESYSRRQVITAYLLVFFSSFLSYLVFRASKHTFVPIQQTVLLTFLTNIYFKTAEKFMKFIIFVARNSIRKEPQRN